MHIFNLNFENRIFFITQRKSRIKTKAKKGKGKNK